MKCTVNGCSGSYVDKLVAITKEVDGQIVVVSGVPAGVCNFCGDVLLTWDTEAQVDQFLKSPAAPITTAPVYEFARQWVSQPVAEAATALAGSNGRHG